MQFGFNTARRLMWAVIWGGTALVSGTVHADVLNLNSTSASGEINEALFWTSDYQSTGSGQLGKSFLRIEGGNNQPFVQGYNTDARSYKNNGDYDINGPKTQYDEKSDNQHTRSITLSDLSVSSIDGKDYYGFLLDIGEPGNVTKATLSMHALQIFQASTGLLDKFTDVSSAHPVYNMDSPVDWRVDLNGNVSSSGNGKADMVVYVPKSNFDATKGNYVYLYSSFGRPSPDTSTPSYANNGGFQEWFTAPGRTIGTPGPIPVPLPAAVWAGLALLTGLACARARRNR